jgi:hypothetical protein
MVEPYFSRAQFNQNTSHRPFALEVPAFKRKMGIKMRTSEQRPTTIDNSLLHFNGGVAVTIGIGIKTQRGPFRVIHAYSESESGVLFDSNVIVMIVLYSLAA